jgi:hypothetical protein
MRIPFLLTAAVLVAWVSHHQVAAVLLAGALVVGYLVSLHLHPGGRTCWKCRGNGYQRGAVFTYATRSCTRCGGNQFRGRYGLRTLHRGSQVWGETRPLAAQRRRARHFGR